MNFQDKYSLVEGVFSSVYSKYDLMNNVMSFGLHKLWKRELLKEIVINDDELSVVDVASGTGDIIIAIRKKFTDFINTRYIAVDSNINMLNEGRKKIIDKNFTDIESINADAESLPIEDSSLTHYIISFGIRNVSNITQALDEAYRVLKPNGKFICLEFSHVQHPLLKSIYKVYSKFCIPQLGSLIAGDKEAYEYLVDSIAKFPTPEKFNQLIKGSGFINNGYRLMNNGIIAIHTGWKN
ncbi:MAG: ubiquinone/menaquinone biosynthesis methyltransferase [Anaplasmataceae bacterium]|nr:ubiquinone/menaquinone biosynthesis methyltransferase [Anaplasmataceae bacterium]